MNRLVFVFIIYFGIILNICQSKDSHNFFYTYTNNGKIVVNCSDTQLNPVTTPNWTTQAFYNASQNLTGWDLLELWSNPSVDDREQAYHAGYIEGYITRQQIWNYYWNIIEKDFGMKNKSNVKLLKFKDYFDTNDKYVNQMITQHPNEPFWHQVDLIYQQMYGMLDGYNNATKDQNLTDQTLTLRYIQYMTFYEDLGDIYNGRVDTKNNTNVNHTNVNNTTHNHNKDNSTTHNHNKDNSTTHNHNKDNSTTHNHNKDKSTKRNRNKDDNHNNVDNHNNDHTSIHKHASIQDHTEINDQSMMKELDSSSHCSAFIKIVPGNSDVLIGHNTWTGYNFMNRILKRYKLAFRVSKNSTELIPGMSTTFSSYPSSLASMDDFYVINSGLVTMETTNGVYNKSLYHSYVHPENEVLEEVRNVVANRLAKNGLSWKKIFEKDNSGTYNNQWMVIDLNRFKPGFDPQEGFLTVIEQAPGMIVGADQTPHILQYGYWASYNIPFYSNISEITGNTKLANQNGSWFSYESCPRAKIFKRDQVKVNDLDSMIWMMRYNYYKTDPYALCDTCNPKPNACNAIAARCDVNPIQGNYTSNYIHPGLFGAIDAKITSFSLFSKGEFVSIGGPTTSGVPPFKWSDADKIFGNNTKRHLGQPDVWDFKPLTTSWILPYTTKPSNNSNEPPMPTTTETNKPKKGKNSSTATQPLSFILYISLVSLLVLKS